MAAALSIAFTATPLGLSSKAIIEATAQMSPGITFIRRSLYKQILVTAATAASPVDALAAYNARFGALTTGKKIGLRVTVISSDGQRSAPLSTTVIVA